MATDDISQNAVCPPRGASKYRPVRRALLAGTVLTISFCDAALLSRPAQANDWIAGVGSWFAAGNWNTNSVPTATDNVTVNNGGTAQVQLPFAEANDVFVGAGSTVRIVNGFNANFGSLSGGGSVVIGPTSSSTFLGIGFGSTAATTFLGSITGAGTLEMSGGSLTLTGVNSIGGDLMVCDCAMLTISGPGASFAAGGDPFGIQGTEVDGTLHVVNGGAFTTAELVVAGSMLVSGANATATINGVTVVGAFPSPVASSLTIENGGVVNSIGGAFIATVAPLSVPNVTVTGAGSTWNVGTGLDVGGVMSGLGSPAALTVANGGVVNVSGVTTIGADLTAGFGPSMITVTGAGSAFNTQTLVIGTPGCGCGHYAGVFTVAQGAAATATDTQIGVLGTLNLGNGGLAGSFVTPTIANDGQIVANFTDAFTLGADISGTGTLNKLGTGTLTLTGNNTYSGATTVSGGKLVVNGSIANSAVDVRSGGTLGGSGTLGELTVGNGGIVAPGNSIGTLNVGGNWTLGSGATYEVELKGGGNMPGTHNDLVNVGGTATIAAGSNILVKPDNGTYATGTKYTIVQAATLTVAALPSITDSLAFLDFTGSYDANNFYLTTSLAVSSFCLPGQTANQCATGNGAFSLGPGNSIYDALLNMSDAQAAAALNQLSGEAHASAQSVFIQNTGFVRDTALARVRTAFEQDGGNAPIMSYAPAAAKIAPAPARRALWTDIVGIGSNNKGNGNAAGIDGREYGFLAGADGFVAGDWTVGALAGYTRSRFNVDSRSSSGDSDNLHLGAYGGTVWGQLGFRAGLANTWHFIDMQRSALAQTLNSDYTARTFQTFGELGYRFDYRAAWFEPFANAAYVAHHTGTFTETGGPAALNARNGDSDTGLTTLGLRGAQQFVWGGTVATARGALGWRHAFGDIVPVSTNSFVGGTVFTIAGAPIARDAAVVEAGLDFRLSEIAILGFGYAGQFAGAANSQSGRMRLSVNF